MGSRIDIGSTCGLVVIGVAVVARRVDSEFVVFGEVADGAGDIDDDFLWSGVLLLAYGGEGAEQEAVDVGEDGGAARRGEMRPCWRARERFQRWVWMSAAVFCLGRSWLKRAERSAESSR